MNTSPASRTLRTVVSAVCLCMAAATAQTRMPPDRDQLERKLSSTSTLIETSTAAKQIEASGISGAVEKRAKARELHGKAHAHCFMSNSVNFEVRVEPAVTA